MCLHTAYTYTSNNNNKNNNKKKKKKKNKNLYVTYKSKVRECGTSLGQKQSF